MKYILLVAVVNIFLFLSCVQESPLSDIDIDDPSIIKPVISINKNITSNSIIFSLTTWLYDKNNNSIDLRSGDVLLNNIKMKLKRGLNSEPYYIIEPYDILPFQINYFYESNIILSDGTSYKSNVTTRGKNLYQLNVPADHNRNQNILITWADTFNDNNLVLTMALSGSSDSVYHYNIYDFDITNPLSGNYVVSKDYFENRPEINKAQFTLQAINAGEINPSFMSGSKISSTISISRSVNLY